MTVRGLGSSMDICFPRVYWYRFHVPRVIQPSRSNFQNKFLVERAAFIGRVYVVMLLLYR